MHSTASGTRPGSMKTPSLSRQETSLWRAAMTEEGRAVASVAAVRRAVRVVSWTILVDDMEAGGVIEVEKIVGEDVLLMVDDDASLWIRRSMFNEMG